MLKPIFAALGLAACASIPAHAGTSPGYRDDPAVITEWNTIAEAAIPASAGVTLPRTYAMMHIAMFDAVNSIEGGYTAYRVRVPAWHAASREAAAAQAAHDVLTALLPAGTATYDAALAARLAKIHPARAHLGSQVGREVAQKILEWRSTDGWSTPQTFTPPALPGVWQPTPPAFAAAGFVQAGDAKPFGLPTPYYYLPRRPPALNSQEYADAVNEIKAIGGVNSTVRTAEQTLQARLWASVGYKEPVERRVEPGHAHHGARSQAVADRVRAPVRTRERHHAGRRADRAGQQVRATSSGARFTPSSVRAKT